MECVLFYNAILFKFKFYLSLIINKRPSKSYWNRSRNCLVILITNSHFMWVNFMKNHYEHPVRGLMPIVPESLCFAMPLMLELRTECAPSFYSWVRLIKGALTPEVKTLAHWPTYEVIYRPTMTRLGPANKMNDDVIPTTTRVWQSLLLFW